MCRQRIGPTGRIKYHRSLIATPQRRKLIGIAGLVVKRLRIDVMAFCSANPTFLRQNYRHRVGTGELELGEGLGFLNLNQA